MSGLVVPVASIRRLTIHDGPGVRDTVFLKGCPLHCIWCHNPECISPQPQLLFHEKVCAECGVCVEVCPNEVHQIDAAGHHHLRRENCVRCGKCVRACLHNALELCGEAMSYNAVFERVVRDRDFFMPVGGVTLSGGEPALYPEFTAELFHKLKQEGISTALDTCGAVDFENYRKILPYTDMVLFDLKGMNPERHRNNTGQGNGLIHDNLRKISAVGIPVEIRMPIVPGHNDFPDDIRETGQLLKNVKSLTGVRLLAYNSLATEKYAALGMTNTMPQGISSSACGLEEIATKLKAFLPPEIIIAF